MNSSGTTPAPEQPGYVWEQFETSVPMSTYLVAFAVARFKSVDKNATARQIPYKVWARPDMIDYAQKAAEYGPAILEHFEEYFKIDYPMPKMDMIALPDFAAGAMENWGLITYREEYLLYEGSQTPAATLVRIVYIIAHELAHMWFGDLVTPEWWNDIWLNEGFASYVEYLGADKVEPGWKWMEQFVFSDLQDVLYLDSLQNSHPISVDVYNPDQIMELFDRISYAKGASIIRMMNHFLTEEVFRNGVTNYLKKFEYQNAVQDDLWKHLNDEANTMQVQLPATVKEIMDTWTLQTGYPVVKATRDGEKVTVNQTRFLLNSTTTEKPTHWYVPLNLVRSSNVAGFDSTNATVWLYPNASTVEFTLAQNDEWYIINAQQTGYYRVNYDERNWEALNKTLRESHEDIHVINRAQILDDALNLALAGHINYTIALSLTQYLGQEESYIPWATTADNLSYLRRMLETTGKYDQYRAYILSLIKDVLARGDFKFPVLEDVPPNGDYQDVTEVMYKELIWGAACQMREPRCIGNATQLFRTWRENYDESTPDKPYLNPNIKGLVYCEGVRSGEAAEWEFVYKHYNNTNYAAERTLLLAAMACTDKSWLLNKYLDMLLTPETSGIRSQDVSRAFAYIAANPAGRDEAFKFVKVNWEKLKDKYSSGLSTLTRFITPFSIFNTEYELNLLKTMKDEIEGSLGSAARAMDQTIESVMINIEWMNKNLDTVVRWLEVNGSTVGPTDPGYPNDVRLPRHLRPTEYDVKVRARMNEPGFPIDGWVTIDMVCNTPADNITLNVHDITVNNTLVQKVTGQQVEDISIVEEVFDLDRDFYILKLSKQLELNQTYRITIDYEGRLQSDLAGYYYSSYVENDETRKEGSAESQR
ncbi:unnamed protein product [Darwinula stevensoni]|nr:unnamed protein product [Darwinula stevensoni]CAG0894462.1 unnamed protein product [Darwinula stevensoni]